MFHKYGMSLGYVALIAFVALGCDRPRSSDSAPAGATSVASRSTSSDTVVRRVLRVLRRPAMIGRVTQDIHVMRALVPLDTTLIVRVYDQRGVELSGVPVRWTLVDGGEGAELRVLATRTDSLGLAGAAFVPGASADTQHVYAEVDSVGRIDFGVIVPATSLQVRLPQGDVWSGDVAPAGAELRDAAGRELTGGQLSWGSSDTTVARVRGADASHGSIVAVGAGNASIVAWMGAGKPQGSAHLGVRAVTRGAFVTLDGAALPSMRMEVRSEGVRESLEVVGGRFSARIPYDPDASVELVASAVEGAAFHPVDVRVHAQRALENIRIALVPVVWRIDAGTYAGRDVPIDAARAMQRTAGSAAFWRLVPLSGNGPRRLLGWAESDLPLRVAFNRSRSSDAISAADSAAFWDIAGRMERDLGMRLFQPAQLRGDTSDARLVTVQIGSQPGLDGHTFVSWAAAGDANDGVMLFRRSSTLRDSHVVTHELLHLIGFGHTNAWPTVSLPSGGSEPALTVQDVAYVQLALRLRRFQHVTGALPGLPVAAP